MDPNWTQLLFAILSSELLYRLPPIFRRRLDPTDNFSPLFIGAQSSSPSDLVAATAHEQISVPSSSGHSVQRTTRLPSIIQLPHFSPLFIRAQRSTEGASLSFSAPSSFQSP